MDEDRFNMSMRKFLKQVGVTSQQEIERVVREISVASSRLKPCRRTRTPGSKPLAAHAATWTIGNAFAIFTCAIIRSQAKPAPNPT